MAKSGKGGKQARKSNGKGKPQAVSETVKTSATARAVEEKTGPAVPEAARVNGKEAGVKEAIAPAKPSFDLVKYFQSGTWVYPLLLIIFMALMFYIRAVPTYSDVFTSWNGNYVNVAADDAVMQMRLVHNTLAHFPDRIMFDPFTHYPFGSVVHFGPLFTLLIAAASLVVGLGSPSAQLVDTVGAYTPVILGVLCALPTYFIGKKLFGRNAAIIAAATLAVMPGQFLDRSMLGFTDHHIAEVLFSATAVAFLVYALDFAKKAQLSVEKIKARDSESWKALGFSVLAGLAFGCYLLVWPGALLVGFMLFIYFAAQSIINHVRGEPLDYLVIVAAIMYLIPVVMVLPYSLQDLSLQLMYYSATQPLFLCIALVSIGIIYFVSATLRKNKVEGWAFPAALGGIVVVGLIVANVALPQVFALTMAGFNVFVPRGGTLTIAEAIPTIYSVNADGSITINFDTIVGGGTSSARGLFWYSFYWTSLASVIAIVLLLFRTWKHNRPAELLFLVWNLTMFWATCSQSRFTYYFAINAALLTGYLAVTTFKYFDVDKYVASFKERVKALGDLPEFLSKHAMETSVFAVTALVFLLVVIYPATTLSLPDGVSPAYKDPWIGGYTMLRASSGGSGMGYEWFSTLTWLRDHTPDPQGSPVQSDFNYADGTYDKVFDANGTWSEYPASAYGVMSWWDYGHDIEYVAQRIPNANPFQAGITENGGKDGSAVFFTSQSESDSYRNLGDLGSRYVIIDNEMATGKFAAINTWVGIDTFSKYYSLRNYNLTSTTSLPLIVTNDQYRATMMNRLYYEDCNGMSHFRLVYESPGIYYVSTKVGDLLSYQQYGLSYVPFYEQYPSGSPIFLSTSDNYTDALQAYAMTVAPLGTSQGNYNQIYYDSKPPVKYVKTYEVVKGATIAGVAPANSTVKAVVTLGINNRTFNYTQTATAGADGRYAIIVPYATDAMSGSDYSSDVRPQSLYTISFGNETRSVAVTERDVMDGETVTVA